MTCSREVTYHFIDGFLLVVAFLFQSVVLNFFIIRHFRASSLTYLWFLCDFIVLFVFAITLFLAFEKHSKIREREKHNSLSLSNSFTSRTNSRAGNRSNTSDFAYQSCSWFPDVNKLPMGYITWIFYSTILIVKILILFKSDIPQTLNRYEFFGPQTLKIGIGVSAFIFSLLVEAHHGSYRDLVRAAYIKNISYGMALEILDTVSFLTLLIGSESHLVYSFKFENVIIIISSINLMLPALAFYKLTVSNYGRTYPIPLETAYKLIHFLLVNVTYFSVRVYLWKLFSADTSIFFVKNVYAILTFLRDIYPDYKTVQLYIIRKRNRAVMDLPRFGHSGGGDAAQASLQANGHARTNGKAGKMEPIEEEAAIGLSTFHRSGPDHEDRSHL